MKSMDEIISIVEDLVRNKIPSCDLAPDSVLTELGLDSYKIMEVIVEIERSFEIEFEPEALTIDILKSVQSISEEVERKQWMQ